MTRQERGTPAAVTVLDSAVGRVRIEAPVGEWTDAVAELFPGCSLGGDRFDPGSPSAWVRADADGWIVGGTGVAPSRHPSLDDSLNALEFAVTQALLNAGREYVQLHASGCVVSGKALLALGRSGAGKSSLATWWCLNGYPTLGDDIVFVGADGRVTPFQRLFKVDPVLLTELGVDLATTVFWDDGSTEAWFDPGSAAGWAEPATIGLVALPRRAKGARFETRDVPTAELLNVLTHSLLATGRAPEERFELLAGIAAAARGVEVVFSRAAEAGEWLAEIAT